MPALRFAIRCLASPMLVTACGCLPAAAPPSGEAVALTRIAGGFAAPVGLVEPNDGSGRLFVIDQTGLIFVIDP